MISVLILTLYDHIVAVDLNILRVGNHRKVKMLCNLRSHLCGIAVDCLTPRDNQIILKVADRACDRGGRRPCIRTAQHPVRHKDSPVRAHRQSLAENLICFRKSHGNHSDFCPILLF